MGAAVLAAQHCPLGEAGHTMQGRWTIASDDCVGKNAVVEGHVDTVVVSIEGDRFHINVGV